MAIETIYHPQGRPSHYQPWRDTCASSPRWRELLGRGLYPTGLLRSLRLLPLPISDHEALLNNKIREVRHDFENAGRASGHSGLGLGGRRSNLVYNIENMPVTTDTAAIRWRRARRHPAGGSGAGLADESRPARLIIGTLYLRSHMAQVEIPL